MKCPLCGSQYINFPDPSTGIRETECDECGYVFTPNYDFKKGVFK
jgi:predicted Zn-ribbon and HTH transcriptional regulator